MGHLSLLVLVVVVREAMESRQLALVEDADDPHAIRLRPVEHHVAHIADPKEPRTDVVAGPANPVWSHGMINSYQAACRR